MVKEESFKVNIYEIRERERESGGCERSMSKTN